jgi:hypothetical protein
LDIIADADKVSFSLMAIDSRGKTWEQSSSVTSTFTHPAMGLCETAVISAVQE